MKILLIGEYSRLHNSLKEGLEKLGHSAVIVSTGDSFKNYTTDYNVAARFTTKPGSILLLKRVLYKIFKLDITAVERAWRFNKILPLLKGFDYVQLINSDALELPPWLAKKLYKKLFNQNGPLSLLVCGDDTPVVEYALEDKLRYSVLTPYLQDKSLMPHFLFTLKYTTKPYRDLFKFVSEKAQAIITSDLDYEIPMQAMGYTTRFIPNPVNTDTIQYSEQETDTRIVIFLGINRLSYFKKGIHFFEEALKIVKEKHPEKAEIIIAENLPYKDYIDSYNRAHIVLDQVYAYDQGYNALEAMAKGKVVFTGAEKEFTKHYNLTEPVAVNALPNAQAIAKELLYFIEHPEEIKAIGWRARAFIEREHNYIKVASAYLEAWKQANQMHEYKN
ncbi:glycosyltransferase family protein [Flavobacterium rhizosphaerae]|uniref:Glycosyltransferase n=1 Tax=Flavobacterium rhizosphaerae TaxID=3163298 RepID=A0ABW8Z2G3_9FLAO